MTVLTLVGQGTPWIKLWRPVITPVTLSQTSANYSGRIRRNVNKLIRTVLALVYIDLRKYSIETQMNLSEQLPPVTGNAVQLQQVILNLVMNAIESMASAAEPRVLSVTSKANEHNAVLVSIADTGRGIDVVNLNRIFKPMFTTKARGMGMGLSICKSIIESHNGLIWVSVGVPRGSIFHFEMPVYSPANVNLV
jgi:signal transduction histidine kinase